MNAALVVMTILGCNDSGTDCRYIETAQERWPTVAICDSVSETRLPGYANQPYPVIIAVCQDPQTAGLDPQQPTSPPPATNPAATAAQTPPDAAPPLSEQDTETLASRAIQRVRNVLPSTEGVKTLMTKPVRLMENGYSWVARKFERD